MATKEENITKAIEDFFSDPKHEKDATFMRGAVKRVLDEIKADEIKNKPPEEDSFFDRLFK